MKELESKLKDVFSEVFDYPKGSINDNLSHNELPQWDSLSHISLVIALEETFNISFEPDEMEKMYSNFGNLKKILAKKIKSNC